MHAASDAPGSFWRRIKEIDAFFAGRDAVHKTMRSLCRRLEAAEIPYAVIGGMAVKLHGHLQTTGDVDVLTTGDGLTEFRHRFAPRYYEGLPNRRLCFTDKARRVGVDFVVTGEFPGNHEPGPIAFPDPSSVATVIDDIEVVDLITLVQLKLAAGRYGDYGDVVALISVHNLDESFADRLHPTLHGGYRECLEEKRREDEYEERNGGHGGGV
jgi:hypothetical protein